MWESKQKEQLHMTNESVRRIGSQDSKMIRSHQYTYRLVRDFTAKNLQDIRAEKKNLELNDKKRNNLGVRRSMRMFSIPFVKESLYSLFPFSVLFFLVQIIDPTLYAL